MPWRKTRFPAMRPRAGCARWPFFLSWVHLALAALSWPVQTALFNGLTSHLAGIIRNSEVDEDRIEDTEVVVICAPDPFTGMYPRMIRHFDGLPLPRAWWTISVAPFDHRLTRTGEKEIELEVNNGQMLSGTFERLCRSAAHPMKPGDAVDLGGFAVTVLEVGDQGPKRIRVIFARQPRERALPVPDLSRRRAPAHCIAGGGPIHRPALRVSVSAEGPSPQTAQNLECGGKRNEIGTANPTRNPKGPPGIALRRDGLGFWVSDRAVPISRSATPLWIRHAQGPSKAVSPLHGPPVTGYCPTYIVRARAAHAVLPPHSKFCALSGFLSVSAGAAALFRPLAGKIEQANRE